MPWCRSPSPANRAGTVAMVNCARVDVVDLVPADGGGDGRLRHPAHRVGAGDRVVAGVLVVVDEQLGGVAVLAPPGRRDLHPARGVRPRGRRRARPGAPRRTPTAARSGRRCAGRCRPRSSATRSRRARRGSRARYGRPGARWRTRSAAWDPGRCATHRAVRCRPGGSSTDGTPRWTSAPPRSRRPVRSRTARRRAGRSGGSAPARSPATAAHRAGPASGAPSPRRPRTGTGASCTAAPAARARCHRRPTGSNGPGPAWSPRGPGSTPGPDWRSAPAGPRPRRPPHLRP